MTSLTAGLWSGIILPRAMIQTFGLRSPTITGFRTHHYMLGIMFIVFNGVSANSPLLHSFGSGLILDELPWLVWPMFGKRPERCYERTEYLVILLAFIFTLFSFWPNQ